MDRMKVVAIKLTNDPHSVKFVYEKGGILFMRTGSDGFSVGKKLQAPLSALITKWGLRKVDNAPQFRDAEEFVDNLTKFDMTSQGNVKYYG